MAAEDDGHTSSEDEGYSSSEEEPPRFTAYYLRSGYQQVEIDNLLTEDDVDLVLDVLSIKEALDGGKDPSSVSPRCSKVQPRLRLLDDERLRGLALGLTFERLVEELHLCACSMADMADEAGAATEEFNADALLREAVMLDCSGLAALLLAAGAGSDFRSLLRAAAEMTQEAKQLCPLELLLRVMPGAEAAVEGLPADLLDWLFFNDTRGVERLLLSAAPHLRQRRGAEVGWTELHFAARDGDAEAAQRALAATPEALEEATAEGYLPAHVAAWRGHADVLRLLLEAAPETAAVHAGAGRTPLHWAAAGGHLEAAAVLLAASPHHAAEQVCAPDSLGFTSVALAAQSGQLAVLQLLLGAAAEAAAVPSNSGSLPLHAAIQHNSIPCLRALLAAAPETARFVGPTRGWTPLHYAAWHSSPEAVRLFLAAAPETATAAAGDGNRWPIELAAQGYGALRSRELVICTLLPFGSGVRVLQALARRTDDFLPLFADFVLCRPPLSEAEWALVPAPCSGLGRALPAALAHSSEQAGQLVRRLPPADAERLHVAALCLHRAQAELPTPLPQPLAWRILSLFDA